jgi:5-methylcytosine-specific restriction endonuclease McrA
MPYQRRGQTHAVCSLGGEVAPVSDFNGRWRDTPNGGVWHFNSSCRYHEETARHEKKAENPALHLLASRAKNLARETGTTLDFILHDPIGPRWIELLPLVEAFLKEHAHCVNCARGFRGTSDMQFDHIHPPRSKDDWARHNVRSIRILCGSCNNTKRQKSDADWVDEQYRWQVLDAKRGAEVASATSPPARWEQLPLMLTVPVRV